MIALRIFTTITGYIIFLHALCAQINNDSPKGMALGSTGVVSSRNLEAISINTSNLAIKSDANWTFSILPAFNINITNSIISFGSYKKYFTGVDNANGTRDPKHLTSEDKTDLLNGFPNDGIGRVGINGEIDVFSISYYNEALSGGFGFKIRERSIGKVDLPKDAFKLLLYGNTPGYNYTFDYTSAYGYWLREYALAFGKNIYSKKDAMVNIGFSLKYLNGYAFFESQKVNSNLITTDSSIEGRMLVQARYSSADFLNSKGNYSVFSTPAGQGFAADFGLAFILNDAFSLGLSITDLGYINWNKNLEEVYVDTVTKIIDVTDEDQFKPFQDIINNHKSSKNSAIIFLPAGLRIGSMLALHNLNYFKKRNFIPIFISTEINYIYFPDIMKPHYLQFGFGIEIKPVYWLPIRAGFSVGSMPIALSFGTGITTKILDLDLSMGSISTVFGASFSKSLSFGFGMTFKI